MKKLLGTSVLNPDMAALVLRVLFGGLFIYYGYMKITMYNMIAPNFPNYVGIGSHGNFILVIFAEFVCGIFILLGLFTRLAVIPTFITMIVAFFVAHAGDAFDVKQVAFIHMILCMVVFMLGSGKYSADHLIFNNRK